MCHGVERVEENESPSQTLLDMINTKNKTLVECVTKNSTRLICLTNQSEILHRAASKVFSGCFSSTPVPLLLIETQLPLLKITLRHQALLCFGRALCLLQKSFNLSQARSQKFAMGGGAVLGVWGRSPQRSKILHFFAKITSF